MYPLLSCVPLSVPPKTAAGWCNIRVLNGLLAKLCPTKGGLSIPLLLLDDWIPFVVLYPLVPLVWGAHSTAVLVGPVGFVESGNVVLTVGAFWLSLLLLVLLLLLSKLLSVLAPSHLYPGPSRRRFPVFCLPSRMPASIHSPSSVRCRNRPPLSKIF